MNQQYVQRRTPRMREGRGSALLLVVVLVLLLAMMGTAFLVAARLSREQISGSGSAALVAAPRTWPSAVIPAGTLESAAESQIAPIAIKAVEDSIKTGAGPTYRAPDKPDYVGFGNTPEQRIYAARTPYLYSVSPVTDIRWSNVSHLDLTAAPGLVTNMYLPANVTPGKPNTLFPGAPPDSVPVDLTVGGTVQGVRIGALQITYNTADYACIPALAGRTRIFPAFVNAAWIGPGDNANVLVLAADADGDGIAESPLQQVDPLLVPYAYLAPPLSADGETHPVSYWYAVRIVDNAGAVNVNTAWRSAADRDFGNVDIVAPDVLERALLGTYRPNVGMYEFLESMVPGSGTDLLTLDTFRMNMGVGPIAGQFPPDEIATSGPPIPPTRTDVQFATQGDALENQLIRRLSSPGSFTAGLNSDAVTATQMLPYEADFDSNSTEDLANRFLFLRTTGSPVRTRMPNGADLYSVNFSSTPNYKDFRYYGASQFDFWFHTGVDWNDYWREAFFTNDTSMGGANYVNANVNYGGTTAAQVSTSVVDADTIDKTMRHMLVTQNPISIRTPYHATAYGNLPPAMRGAGPTVMPPPAGGDVPAKVAVNLAFQGQLWRAFWETMVNDTLPGTPEDLTTIPPTPAILPTPQDPAVFASALRYNPATANLESGAQALLRAAQAAANLVSLRDKAVPSANNTISNFPVVVGGVRQVGSAMVYGLRPQPYITEVYVNNDNVTDKGSGPNTTGYYAIELFNPYARTTLNLGDLYICSLQRSGATRTAGTLALTQLSGTLGPQSYVVLDNVGGGGAVYRPALAGTPGAVLPITNLSAVRNEEFVIFRVPTTGYVPTGPLDPNLIPVDAFDFLGMPNGTYTDPGSGIRTYSLESWHYVRQNDVGTPNNAWYCVYPGQYAIRAARRQEGTVYHDWPVTWDTSGPAPSTESEPAAWTADPINLRPVNITPPVALGAADGLATCGTKYQIPLNLEDWPSPLPPGTAHAPFGAFMRDGDILQVPFIGASRVLDNAGNLVEVISVTMDAAFSEDGTADADQQIGRFVSMSASKGSVVATDHEAWCGKLFNYLTAIQNPDTNTMPNINAVQASVFLPVSPVLQPVTPPARLNVQGKININTAPWQVLATLPLVRIGDPGITTAAEAADATRALAKAIVRYRDVDGDPLTAGNQPPHGPFTSIMDLLLVPAYAGDPTHELGEPAGPNIVFRDAAGGATTVDSGWASGNLSAGLAGAGDTIVNDFMERTIAVTRISNLIATRSDSFTAYIVVQAWVDAGTKYPSLLAEHRAVLTIDRSQMNPSALTITPATDTHYWTITE